MVVSLSRLKMIHIQNISNDVVSWWLLDIWSISTYVIWWTYIHTECKEHTFI